MPPAVCEECVRNVGVRAEACFRGPIVRIMHEPTQQHRTGYESAPSRLDRGDALGRLGPRTCAMICSSLAVCTGVMLGIEFLLRRLIGLPIGAWIVMAGVIGTHLCVRRGLIGQPGSAENRGRLALQLIHALEQSAETLGVIRDRARNRLYQAEQAIGRRRDGALESARDLGEQTMAVVGGLSRTLARRISDLTDRAANPGAPSGASADAAYTLRIGVDLPRVEAQSLIAAGPVKIAENVRIKWVRVDRGSARASEEDLRGLDALVVREARAGGCVQAVFPERPDKPAAWYDWSQRLPMSYAAVFPARLDSAKATLAGCNFADADQSRLAAWLIVAGAAWSRTPGRVGNAKGLTGMLRGGDARGPIGCVWDRTSAVHASMSELLRAFAIVAGKFADGHAGADSNEKPEFVKAAARIVGAWCVVNDAELGAVRREEIVDRACEGLEEEPEQVLRLAAAQFGSGQDEAGLRSLLWARRKLVAGKVECIVDPLLFVQSELELGGRAGTGGRGHAEQGLSLGRVAAGMTLLWATAPISRHPYLRDDLMDDLQHAGWVGNNPHARAVLQRVMDELDRAEETDEAWTSRRAA